MSWVDRRASRIAAVRRTLGAAPLPPPTKVRPRRSFPVAPLAQAPLPLAPISVNPRRELELQLAAEFA